MPTRSPLEYELTPDEIDIGIRWVTLTLRNVGDADLHNLSVRLNSTDTYQIDVNGAGNFVPVLRVNEAQSIPFQVTAQGTARLFASIDGQRGDEDFHWESSGMRIVVGLDVAELVSLYALTEPYPTLGSTVTLEATIRGLAPNLGLGLEFWADTPDDTFVSIAKMPTDPIAEGETVQYTAEFTPKTEGIYILHAYLFAGVRRIDHTTENLSITR